MRGAVAPPRPCVNGRRPSSATRRAAGVHRHPAACDTQAAERVDILNVGGFSDVVFEMIANFAEGRMGAGHWVGEIEAVTLGVQ